LTDSEARRTCVACRDEEERDELVRLVAGPDGQIAVDLRARLPGRGAWVHPTPECVRKLEAEPRRLGAALRAEGLVTSGLFEQLRGAVVRQVLDGLSLAARAGVLLGGADVVSQALADGRVSELIVAQDASPRTVESVQRSGSADVPVTVLPLGKDDLGARIGQPSRAVVAMVIAPAFLHLREQLRRLRRLG
jgi:uncharacterized protein